MMMLTIVEECLDFFKIKKLVLKKQTTSILK